MNTLDEWTGQVCAALGIEPGMLDRDAVLDLTRDVAHGVARPAAPLTAYLLGVAVGRSGSADLSALVAKVRALIPPEGS
ncbi:MAG: molybdopterin-guanine dinucleotide biosynthesis protein MobA [Frankiaceae bacterium]|nr:molybdopterin-guanine dinucleotide biosynthesis protein MobA [Frankiaceae bacterium]